MKPIIRAILAISILAVSCKKSPEKTFPAEEKITESVYASGIVKSRNQYQAFATVSGLVSRIWVVEGDTIKKGSPILQLSDANARLNTENARIAADYSTISANADKLKELNVNIDQARIKMENDASLLNKQKNLWTQGIGTQNDLDQRELQYKTSTNNYKALQLRYNDLKQQLDFQEKQSRKKLEIAGNSSGDYTVRSEVNGKVYKVLKEKGEMVTPQTPIAIIGDASGFYLELQVDEYDIARIKSGQKTLLNMDSYKNRVFEAVITRINPIMNEQSKSFTVEAEFINQPPTLYPNLTAEANIIIESKEKAITIPRAYLLEDGTVLLSNKEKRKVKTGLKDYQKVEILEGLSTKDEIMLPAQ